MNRSFKSDKEIFELAKKELFTAVVGDVMDKLGKFHQFLPPNIQPLRDDMVLIGRAMPVLEADVFPKNEVESKNEILQKSFGLMLEALDDLKEDEVYICSGASPNYALWGENMSIRAMKLGAGGAVVNGYSRDSLGIQELNFPTFSIGRYAQDQAPRGKVIDYRISIEIEGTTIDPGDIIFGDMDGVCVIPKEIEDEVFEKAIIRVRGENKVNKSLKEGLSAVEAFNKYGIM